MPARNRANSSLDISANNVWISDSTEGFKLAEVVSAKDNDKTLILKLSNGKNVEMSNRNTASVNPPEQDGVADNTNLMHLHEPALLHNVRYRYARDEIYTYTAYILIAVNPYKKLPIYSDEEIFRYKGKSIGVLPPHVYAVCDRAYRLMKAETRSQSVVISGESGSGKTETSKIVMRYLAVVGGQKGIGELEEKILNANPILEAFGNAKTLRNNNSSRFGKFTELHFDRSYHVCGASIVTYLLEKSRLVNQVDLERNYHIFYCLLEGASPEEKVYLDLDRGVERFNYTNRSSCVSVEGVDDSADYQKVRKAMKRVGMTDEMQNNIIRLLAAILHVGNVEFRQGRDENAIITTEGELASAAGLLGVSEAALSKSLTIREMASKDKNTRPIKIPLNKIDSTYSRDALCKSVYGHLFDFIVSTINVSLKGSITDYTTFIGVLDIYGFECFAVNGFEQLCINYANEKLQQLFNTSLFVQEQNIYDREGIVYNHIEYQDNQVCIDLIEAKPDGLMAMMDEEARLPKGSDESYTSKVHSKFAKNAYLKAPKITKTQKLNRNEGFVVQHFAGAVTYSTQTGFLDKNNDTLNPDLLNLMVGTEWGFLRSLFQNEYDAAVELKQRAGKNKRFATVGGKFVVQLDGLMTDLNNTAAHFIRCVKPNPEQLPGRFNGVSVMEQLRCGGMMEALRLMHTGFPTRCPYDDLSLRYKDIMPPIVANLDSQSFCEALLMAMDICPSDYQLGITKIFFRAGKLAFLDELRSSEYETFAPAIAEKVRRWLIRKRWKRACNAAIAMHRLTVRLRCLRAFKKFRRAAVVMLIIRLTFLKRARAIRRRNAASRIQALVKCCQQQRRYKMMRSASVVIQTRFRGWSIRRKYADKLVELRHERHRREGEERAERCRIEAENKAREKEEEKRKLQERLVEIEAQKLKRKAEKEQEKLARKNHENALIVSTPVNATTVCAPAESLSANSVVMDLKKVEEMIEAKYESRITALEKRLEEETCNRIALEVAITKLQETVRHHVVTNDIDTLQPAVSPSTTPSRKGKMTPLSRRRSQVGSISSPIKGKKSAKLPEVKKSVPEDVVLEGYSGSAFSLLSALADSRPQQIATPAATIPLSLEPITKLQRAVQSVVSGFEQASNQVAFGDDVTNVSVHRLVRGELCSALLKIFFYGFKSWRLIGRYHVCDFFDRLDSPEGILYMSKENIEVTTGIGTVNTFVDMKKRLDTKFRALICYLLNHKSLHKLLDCLRLDNPLVLKFYEKFSFVRQESQRQNIYNILEQLRMYPFCLDLEFELKCMDT